MNPVREEPVLAQAAPGRNPETSKRSVQGKHGGGICREGGLSNFEYIYEACVKRGGVGSLEMVSCSVDPSLQSGDATMNQPWSVPSVGQESLSNIIILLVWSRCQ